MAYDVNDSLQDEEEYEVIEYSFTEEVDDIGPPPAGFISQFKSVNEWLSHICKNEKPVKAIQTYNFTVWEQRGEYTQYTLCLTGTNSYVLSKDHHATRIEFTPQELYFPLPASEYKDLEREEVFARLTSELTKFISTDTFASSFLSKANAITTNWSGEIWSKPQ